MFRLVELLGPLAAAADAGAGLPPETGARTALVGMRLAQRLGIASPSDAYYAGLLRHLGCSATAHEETQLMGDEQELHVALGPVDAASPVQMLGGAARGFARGKSAGRRLATIAKFMVRAPSAVPPIFAARCEVAGQLARRLQLGDAVIRALDEAYERFDGKGLPRRKRRDQLSPLAAVLAVAETAAMFLKLPGGEALACRVIDERAGGQFDPAVCRAFLAHGDELLAEVRADSVRSVLVAAEPLPHRTVANARDVALVLADFADLKSSFTLGHSRGVAALARAAAAASGLEAAEVDAAELAGWLHDLGRVCVSNAIWDHPGPLDDGQWDKVRAHPWFTERVLESAAPWRSIARLAASDHERMDGAGYPRGAPAPNVGMAARILAAADVYQALIEARPHRPAFAHARAAEMLVADAERGRLDRAAVNAVLGVAGHETVRAALPCDLTEREHEVLALLVRGLVDKEIAQSLGISHRTVHHHNQRIFAKIGVTTRGAAALFAIENGLV